MQVEVESEELKAQVAVLSDKIFDLERRCADREKTVAELQMKTESLKDKVSISVIMQVYRISQRQGKHQCNNAGIQNLSKTR